MVWNGAPVTRLNWEDVPLLGDEQVAQQPKDTAGKKKDKATRLSEYTDAVLANRQVATLLRSQGLNEHADRFAYRAQRLQQVVLWRQALLRVKGQRRGPLWRLRKLGAYTGFWFLASIAGYGYRPGRSILAYMFIIAGFAAAYFTLGTPSGHALTWYESLVVSLTAFHGRGFFATQYSPGDPQSIIAAVEAVVGLLIEITFIATFTQRFFAR